MMPLKSFSLLWASIVLLVATSSTATVVTAPDLGTAVNFTVKASSTITNTGFTTVGGYIGVWPGSEITGGTQDYIIYSAEPSDSGRASTADAEIAAADVKIAYNYAADLKNATNIDVANIGGATFYPGLFVATLDGGSLEVSTGDLTLSGDGVFIFQMAERLSMSSGRKTFLADGASASKIFWKVGSSAVFDTDSEAVGTVMADAEIAMKTRAKITGRLFSVNAAVTLESNAVVFPFPNEQ